MKQNLKLIPLVFMLLLFTGCRTLSTIDFSWVNYFSYAENHHQDESDFSTSQSFESTQPEQEQKTSAQEERNNIVNEARLRKKKEYHQYNDFTFSLGAYFHRQGVLKRLGEMGPTFGFTYASFDDDKVDHPDKIGFFIHWSFDHFFETNSNLLQPKFFNENYTNYLLAFGVGLRWFLSPSVQLHYKGGFALNFIEIDSFGPGDIEKDRELSDLTVSTIHKLSLDVRPYRSAEWRFGPGLFYYFAPDPLGKFSADGIQESTGGSWAWTIDFTWEYY